MSQVVTAGAAVVAAALAGSGAWLIYGSVVRPTSAPPARNRGKSRAGRRRSPDEWLVTAGLPGVSPSGFAVSVLAVALAGGVAAWLLFSGVLAPVAAAVFAGTFPVEGYRRRRRDRLDAAVAVWPRLLEEIRLRTGSLGRSVPQALFEAGRAAPEEWRPAFATAEREWLLTTDFAATLAVLRDRLADPTADVVCETLLLAHEIGGTDLETRLGELIDDRTADVQDRKDAASRLAGVRFARRFVLLVPVGMAVAGLTIGGGRAAYATTGGQVAVAAGVLAVAACWWWSGRLMRIPGAPRVFR